MIGALDEGQAGDDLGRGVCFERNPPRRVAGGGGDQCQIALRPGNCVDRGGGAEMRDVGNGESEMKPRVPLAVDSTGAAFRTFGVKRFPAIAFIDTRGRLMKLVEGDAAEFSTAISSLQSSK